MLTTRADEIKVKIAELKRLTEIARRVKEYDSRAKQLEQSVLTLTMLNPILSEFHRRSIDIEIDAISREAKTLQTLARGVLTRFNEDPATIVESDAPLLHTFWNPLDELPKDLRIAVRSSWQAYVDTLLPNAQEDLLSILAKLPGFGDQVKNIRELAWQAAAARQKLPQSPADFDGIIGIAKSLQKAWEQLTGTGLSDELLIFLRNSVGFGAELSTLTPTVHAWLEDHELIPATRVILRSLATGA